MDGSKLLEAILILVPIVVAIYLIRLSKTLTLEKRLADFAITSVHDDEVSFFDKAGDCIWRIIHRMSRLFKKSVFLRNYGAKYDKFIPYEQRNQKDGIDFVTIKILLVLLTLCLGIITMIIHYQNFKVIILLIILIISFFLPDIYLNIAFNYKRKRIEQDLLKAIIIMNNAFSSGKNIMQAIEIVKIELDGPIQDEFAKIYLDITYGLGLDVVFKRFYERVKLEDAKYITTALTLLSKTGGDIVKVFAMMEKNILDKRNLRGELISLTSSSRFVFHFLVLLPLIFSLIILCLNPTYFKPFIASSLGIIMLVFILVLYVLYIFIVKKVLEVKL